MLQKLTVLDKIFTIFLYAVVAMTKFHRTRTTDCDKLTANQRFRHSDSITNFITVILLQSEGLGKMALGIVKYAYYRSSQLISVI